MKESNKKNLIALKKSRSLLDKIIAMIEADQYCIDVVQQNLAVMGLLKGVNLSLLEGHLSHCFVNAAKSNNKKRMDEMTQEVLTIVKTAQNK